MASGPSVLGGQESLDMLFDSDADIRLWTVAPNFDGTGGTEVVGGDYEPALFIANPAVVGSAGQIVKKTNAASFFFQSLPVASSGIAAISVHRHSTGQMLWLNDSYSPPVAWAVGESPSWPPGTFAVAFVPVS